MQALPSPISIQDTFAGRQVLLTGASGFLGKVWVSMLLHRYPDIGHLYLLVRAKEDQSPEERFWSQIAASPTFDPIREQHPGAEFEAFLREKITPVAGDVVQEKLGLGEALLGKIRGTIHAVVNVSGVVDFNPPLDEALEVNAFGVTNLVSLAKRLNACVMHTSTCYVAGYREGLIEEVDPLGYTTYREYDPLGNLLSETKEGHRAEFTYEAGGLIETITTHFPFHFSSKS